MSDTLQALLTASPITLLVLIVGGLGYVIYLLVINQRGQNKIASNHLHPLPEIAETLKRIENSLSTLALRQEQTNETLSYIKGRLNGKS